MAMNHTGIINVAKLGSASDEKIARMLEPRAIRAVPRIKHPCMPQRPTNQPENRAVIIITTATVENARLKPSWENPAPSIITRGEMEKKTKNAPIAELKPRVYIQNERLVSIEAMVDSGGRVANRRVSCHLGQARISDINPAKPSI